MNAGMKKEKVYRKGYGKPNQIQKKSGDWWWHPGPSTSNHEGIKGVTAGAGKLLYNLIHTSAFFIFSFLILLFVQKSGSPSGQNIPTATLYKRIMTKVADHQYTQEQTFKCCCISPGSITPGNKPGSSCQFYFWKEVNSDYLCIQSNRTASKH